jgi:hypothetical protein
MVVVNRVVVDGGITPAHCPPPFVDPRGLPEGDNADERQIIG